MEEWRGPPILHLHVCNGVAIDFPFNNTLAKVDPLKLSLLLCGI